MGRGAKLSTYDSSLESEWVAKEAVRGMMVV